MNTTIKLFADSINRNSVEASNAGAAGALFAFLAFAFIFTIVITVFVFWVISLIHLIQNEDVKDRVIWIVLLFVVGGIMGPVYYFAVKKPYEKAKATKNISKKK